MNTGTLSGRLAADPQVEQGQNTSRTRFRLAVDAYNPSTKQREADFFTIVAFGKTAEIIGQYCHKGSYVVVRTHLKPRQWNDTKTGEKRYETSIVCDEVELGPRTQPAQGGQGGQSFDDGWNTNPTPAGAVVPGDDPFDFG